MRYVAIEGQACKCMHRSNQGAHSRPPELAFTHGSQTYADTGPTGKQQRCGTTQGAVYQPARPVICARRLQTN